MKTKDKYILIGLVFVILMLGVFVFFSRKFDSTDLLNETNYMLSDLYKIDSGKYELKNGVLYNDKNIKIGEHYVKASGFIEIDKYKNVRFLLHKDNSCISKTYVGKVTFNDKVCEDYKTIEVSMSRNNNIISFSSETKNLSYLVSTEDDFKGEWIEQEEDENIIIKTYNEGKNYIWFKDQEGNLSEVVEFEVDCLVTSNADFNSGVFYCSGSTIYLDNMKWVVIKDSNTSIKLMRYLPIDEKLAHCTECGESCTDYCTEDNFKWSNSYINMYLNHNFINELSEDTINKLSTFKICDDYETVSCDDEICGGRLEKEILVNNYTCNNYTESKVKLISYNEFNYLYSKTKNKDVLKGNYWAINSFNPKLGTSIQYNLDFYILESPNNKLDVRPVIIINK